MRLFHAAVRAARAFPAPDKGLGPGTSQSTAMARWRDGVQAIHDHHITQEQADATSFNAGILGRSGGQHTRLSGAGKLAQNHCADDRRAFLPATSLA
jgi:hypothetical protein